MAFADMPGVDTAAGDKAAHMDLPGAVDMVQLQQGAGELRLQGVAEAVLLQRVAGELRLPEVALLPPVQNLHLH